MTFGDLVRWPSSSTTRHVLYGIVLGYSLFLTSFALVKHYQLRRRQRFEFESDSTPIELHDDRIIPGLTGLIGNTPLVRINSLSDALGVEILGKAEFLNPGGSIKDRVALKMIDNAERLGFLYPNTGSRIFEGTVGSTGISIATIARAKGYNATIIIPDDVSEEKEKVLRALGADVERVRPASIVDRNQYVNLARQRATDFGHASITESNDRTSSLDSSLETSHTSSFFDPTSFNKSQDKDTSSSNPRGYFTDQFENRSNYDAHFDSTGPEIWKQTSGCLHAFVTGAGTGGTIAGVGTFIKSMKEDVIVALADPEGSGLYNRVKYGVLYDKKESEGTKRRHQVDTVVEGIGLNRVTKNIELALPIIDDAFRVTDIEAVSMSRFLVQNDGLFLGSSSACNLVACVKLVQKMGWKDGQTIVTILCDSGDRHYSKFWNDEYLRGANIIAGPDIVVNLLKIGRHDK